ncbi:DUF2785 domain-containing protein [Kitasatospora sp. NPDC059646]|uniref:DUF2785 domain-containing protein n=1 Tax=Kitasatospora sp. NPDC059646 TaxID=3346893 RepID=UPI0036888DBB
MPGLSEERRLALGDATAARFEDAEVRARTFAPLVLAAVVRTGHQRPGRPAAFAHRHPAEADLRGHHTEPGRLHAAAHGADLLAPFGPHPEVAPEPLTSLGAARLLAPTGHVFDAPGDDRLGHAPALPLARAGADGAPDGRPARRGGRGVRHRGARPRCPPRCWRRRHRPRADAPPGRTAPGPGPPGLLRARIGGKFPPLSERSAKVRCAVCGGPARGDVLAGAGRRAALPCRGRFPRRLLPFGGAGGVVGGGHPELGRARQGVDHQRGTNCRVRRVSAVWGVRQHPQGAPGVRG